MSPERISLIGMILAVYAALLSTINSLIQVINHRRDRADVVLQVRRNMKTTSPRYKGMTLTLVTATNRGRRPVTIQGFSAKLLDSTQEFLMTDVQPPLGTQISESQCITAFVDQSWHSSEYIECYYVWDSVGRFFRINLVPWHRRLVSRFRRRFFPVERIKRGAV